MDIIKKLQEMRRLGAGCVELDSDLRFAKPKDLTPFGCVITPLD